MNNARRKQIADAIQKIEEAKTLLEIVRDEEQDAFDNIPEGIQSSERGQKMEAAISSMDDAINDIENIVGSLETASE